MKPINPKSDHFVSAQYSCPHDQTLPPGVFCPVCQQIIFNSLQDGSRNSAVLLGTQSDVQDKKRPELADKPLSDQEVLTARFWLDDLSSELIS